MAAPQAVVTTLFHGTPRTWWQAPNNPNAIRPTELLATRPATSLKALLASNVTAAYLLVYSGVLGQYDATEDEIRVNNVTNLQSLGVLQLDAPTLQSLQNINCHECLRENPGFCVRPDAADALLATAPWTTPGRVLTPGETGQLILSGIHKTAQLTDNGNVTVVRFQNQIWQCPV